MGNKGIASIAAILILVVVVSIAAGGIYYLSQESSPKTSGGVANPEIEKEETNQGDDVNPDNNPPLDTENQAQDDKVELYSPTVTETTEPENLTTGPREFSVSSRSTIYIVAEEEVVELHAYDEDNLHTGLVFLPEYQARFPEDQIPNSYYESFGSGVYLGLSPEYSYIVNIIGIVNGEADLKIRVANEDLSTINYLPVLKQSKGSMQIISNEDKVDIQELDYDLNGDGINDYKISWVKGITPDMRTDMVLKILEYAGWPPEQMKKTSEGITAINSLFEAGRKEDVVVKINEEMQYISDQFKINPFIIDEELGSMALLQLFILSGQSEWSGI